MQQDIDQHDQAYDRLIGQIYEAGALPELWPTALQEVARVHGAVGGNLICRVAQDIVIRSSETVRAITLDFDRMGYNRDNSRVERLLRRSHHAGFLTDSDLHTPDEIESIPLYRDFLTPRGFAAGAATVVGGPGQELIVAMEGFTGHEQSRRAVPSLDRLRPHIARAVTLSGRILEARATTLTDAFDAIGSAVAILTSNRTVLRASAPFEAALDRFFVAGRQRLTLYDAATNARFARCFHENGQGCSLALRGGQAGAAVLHVLPMRGEALDLIEGGHWLAVLAMLENDRAPSADLLMALFDLTPAETRVARAISVGQAPRDIAQAGGASLETVRAQLKRVMAKTSTHRQSELSALLAKLR